MITQSHHFFFLIEIENHLIWSSSSTSERPWTRKTKKEIHFQRCILTLISQFCCQEFSSPLYFLSFFLSFLPLTPLHSFEKRRKINAHVLNIHTDWQTGRLAELVHCCKFIAKVPTKRQRSTADTKWLWRDFHSTFFMAVKSREKNFMRWLLGGGTKVSNLSSDLVYARMDFIICYLASDWLFFHLQQLDEAFFISGSRSRKKERCARN